MKVGDLVKLKHQGNGQPSHGLIVDTADNEYLILWDLLEWSISRWQKRELEVISESR